MRTILCTTIMLLNKTFDSGTVICPRAVVLAQGRRQRAKMTVPRTNNSVNIKALIE